MAPVRAVFSQAGRQLSETYISVVAKRQLETPSIGSGRKAHFPVRPRFFDPGVCSRSGWTVSSRDVEFVVQFEQRLNSDERFAEGVGFESKSVASRLFGVCVLHVRPRKGLRCRGGDYLSVPYLSAVPKRHLKRPTRDLRAAGAHAVMADLGSTGDVLAWSEA